MISRMSLSMTQQQYPLQTLYQEEISFILTQPWPCGTEVGVIRYFRACISFLFADTYLIQVLPNVFVGSEFLKLSKSLNVTLATHCTANKLHWLIKSLKTWSGPASVTVFSHQVSSLLVIVIIVIMLHDSYQTIRYH